MEHDDLVIATPAHLHIPVAPQAGKELLIGKPLSVSLRGIELLDRTIGERKLVYSVAYVLRHIVEIEALKQALETGRFGRPLLITIVRGPNFPASRPNYTENCYADHAEGGRAVQDGITHLIGVACWLAGPVKRLAGL